jgi:hypothetical protein
MFGHFIAFFNSRSGGDRQRRNKNIPKDEELKMLNEKIEKGAQGEMELVNPRNVVKINGRNHWNENISYGDRLYSCPNCPDSVCVLLL